MRKTAYCLDLYGGDWVALVREVRLVLTDADPVSQRARAAALRDRVADLTVELELVGGPTISKAEACGQIIELPDPECPVGAKYEFADLTVQHCFLTYTTLRTLFNRILWTARLVLDGVEEAAALDEGHQALCRQIWMCLPYTRKTCKMATLLFDDQLFLSFEGASGEVKEYLLDWIMNLIKYRQRLPDDRSIVEAYVLDLALAMTGRSTFRERAEFPYYERSPAARRVATES